MPWIGRKRWRSGGPWLRPGPGEYGLVIALNGEGEIVTSLHDTRGDYLWGLTSARVHGDELYFGSLYSDRLGKLPLNAIPGMGPVQ